MIKALISGLFALSLAAPAAAETEISTKSKDLKKQRCVTQKEIGTRLAKKRVCMSEAKWREMQQETRRDLDQALGQKPSYLE
jgi:hypothetical protein